MWRLLCWYADGTNVTGGDCGVKGRYRPGAVRSAGHKDASGAGAAGSLPAGPSPLAPNRRARR